MVFLPPETTLTGSFQEILGYAERIRLAWMDHLTGFNFTHSTQTIAFTFTEKPLHNHSIHHFITISSAVTVHVSVHCINELSVCILDSHLDAPLRSLLKILPSTKKQCFHWTTGFIIMISTYIWSLHDQINHDCSRKSNKTMITHFQMRIIDAVLISVKMLRRRGDMT